MPRYLVGWEIDIEDANSHEDAARQAFAIMQRPNTSATVFDVIEHDTKGEAVKIDLDFIDDLPVSSVAADENPFHPESPEGRAWADGQQYG